MKRFRIPRRQKMFAVLPTLLTLGNAVCGFGAITFAAKVGLQPFGWGKNDTQCLFIAAMLVFLAMVFDMLDGRAARWAKQTSQFGAELDSLCDAISFGVAPAFILIKFVSEVHEDMPMLAARLLWSIAVLYVMCAILRLARFNVETDEEDTHEFFSGLPSPAAAGTVVSFMIAYPEIQNWANSSSADPAVWARITHSLGVYLLPALQFVVPLVALACACLMVSRIRYSHVFNQWFRGRRSHGHILQLVVGAVTVFLVKELAVPLIFCLFAFGSPLRTALAAARRKAGEPGPSVATQPSADGGVNGHLGGHVESTPPSVPHAPGEPPRDR
jgi:CDP-diacylglycerol--serine O-phosphatidyltransferase